MALKWESVPDDSFKYKWSGLYGTTNIHLTVMYLGYALSAPVVYHSSLYYSIV
jgi:hypothetical protein